MLYNTTRIADKFHACAVEAIVWVNQKTGMVNLNVEIGK
jgi:hypothetical protein